MTKKRVVVIGGGTGTYTLLSGLKHYADELAITAIVTMADSGGSTGRLRDEFGYLPVGDVRMALSALAADVETHEHLLRELFLYRFSRGEGLEGHNFGNLLLTALTDILGSEVEAIETASRILRVSGQVVPVTTDNSHLTARYTDGVVVVGEHAIDSPDAARHSARIAALSLTPTARLSRGAAVAVAAADVIILGPGDLYTSILANCVVEGMASALEAARAPVWYVGNLMARPGQTIGMELADYVSEIERYIRRPLNGVLVHAGDIDAVLVSRYVESENVHPVMRRRGIGVVPLVEANILSTAAAPQQAGDTVVRSFIRHDSQRLAAAVRDIIRAVRPHEREENES